MLFSYVLPRARCENLVYFACLVQVFGSGGFLEMLILTNDENVSKNSVCSCTSSFVMKFMQKCATRFLLRIRASHQTSPSTRDVMLQIASTSSQFEAREKAQQEISLRVVFRLRLLRPVASCRSERLKHEGKEL